MEVLIDHTGFHALSRSNVPRESVGKHTREILQLIELLLLNMKILSSKKRKQKFDELFVLNSSSKNS